MLLGYAVGSRGKGDGKAFVATGPTTSADSSLSIPFRTFPGSQPASGASGSSPTSPIPLRQEGRPVGLQWSVKVVDVTRDASAVVRAADPLQNKSAPAGRQYFMATVELSFRGPGSEAPSAVDLQAVGASNFVYRPSRDTCGVIPQRYSDGRSVKSGETVQANVCWAVKTEDVSSLVLIAQPLLSDSNPLYFALR